MNGPSRGQILPLFAVFLIGLFAIAALAIDVSSAYSARQAYRTAADAASLAGAQDLQVTGTRAVTPTERTAARSDSLQSLKTAFGATGVGTGLCNPSSNLVDCELAGTPFKVSIKTPSPTCVACDPTRSIQVNVSNPRFELTFARVLGIGRFNVASTAVAGLAWAKSYAIQTLRPPKATGSTFDVNDIVLNGNGTVINVDNGDVGSNANMTYSGTGTVLNLTDGYGMYYFDPYNAPKWYTSPPFPPNQVVQQLPSLITDPNYRYPAMSGARTAPVFDDARASQYLTAPAVQRADVDATCAAEAAKVDPTRYTFMATQPLNTIYCYNPGVYQSGSGARDAQINIGTGDVGILKPGAYYLKNGLDVGGRLVGGYEPNLQGVAIMLNEAGPGNCPSCVFKGNNALTIALNAGTKFPFGTAGSSATAAIDWDNKLVETSGAGSPNPPLPLTLLVRKDTGGSGGTQACVVPTSAPFVEPSGCQDNKNQAINIAGGGQLDLAGVQYAPTDNVAVSGSSDGRGTVGQIIAWTVAYSGGTTLNQQGPGTQGPGTLRLDAACSVPGVPCNP